MKILSFIRASWHTFLLNRAIRRVKKEVYKLEKLRDDLVHGGVINWQALMNTDIKLDDERARLDRLLTIKSDLL